MAELRGYLYLCLCLSSFLVQPKGFDSKRGVSMRRWKRGGI
jgi:hypothetical protein